MNRILLGLAGAAALMLLSACKDVTHVQTGYVADRDECRGSSESNVGLYSQPDTYGLSDRDRNVALLQLFCECMKGKDWKVAGCPKAVPPVTVAQTPQPQPTVVVVQSPTAQPANLAEPEPVATPIKHGKKKAKVCMPPTTCAAPIDVDNAPHATKSQSDDQLKEVILQQ